MRTTEPSKGTDATVEVAFGVPDVVAGASRGFTILLLGELVVLAISSFMPGAAAPGISIVAAAAFVAAGKRGGRNAVLLPRRTRAARGATAALGAYGLTIPLAVIGGVAVVTVPQVLFTSAIAVLVGSIAAQSGPRTGAGPQ